MTESPSKILPVQKTSILKKFAYLCYFNVLQFYTEKVFCLVQVSLLFRTTEDFSSIY